MRPPTPSSDEVDGVKPIDYPATYEILMRSLCVRPRVRAYCEDEFPWRRQCWHCYRPGRYRCTFRSTEAHGYRAKLAMDEHIETVVECFRCDKEIIWVRPAHSCNICISLYLDNKETVEEWVYNGSSIEIFKS